MTATLIMFLSRKPGVTIEEFIDHYENKHLPLFFRALGDAKPLRHTRYYPKRNPAAQGDAEVPPPLLYLGDASTIDYDCIAIVELEDEAHFKRFNEAMANSPLKKEIHEDQATFADPSKFKLMAIDSVKVSKD